MRFRKAILTFAIAGMAISFSLRGATAPNACFIKALKNAPGWIGSLELNSETNQILIADPKQGKLFAYDLKAEAFEDVDLPSDLPVSSITKIEGGFLVKYRDDAAIISPTYKVLKDKINIRSAKYGGVSGLGPLYSNWITSGSTFVGFGSVANFDPASTQYNPLRRFRLGFVKGQVSAASGDFRNVQLLEATEENTAYLLSFPYFAANDDGIFFVRMTSPYASIVRVRNDNTFGTASLSELAAFPRDFRTLPDLATTTAGPASVKERFDKIEGQAMAAGLFGQGKLLYLLARRPFKDNPKQTEWLVYQIDPKRFEPVGAVRLPTRAPHLSIVTSPTYWYMFERGHVVSWGNQKITSVIKVPTRWITSPTSSKLSLDDQNSTEVKCIRQ
jgi:hypothetical protein